MMEEKGYIEIKITNKDHSLSPKDIDINEIKELISDVETLLYPDAKKKRNRPPISYHLEQGSVKHKFFLPVQEVKIFKTLTEKIKKKNSIDFLEDKRQTIIGKFQKKAIEKGYEIELNNSIDKESSLSINSKTSFKGNLKFYESEFYLYGEIYQEGGKKPNLHISTEEYGNLTIQTTKEQILSGKQKLYKTYGVKVRGKKNFEDNTFSNLVLLEFIEYKPSFDKELLDEVTEKASENLSKIKNVDEWLNEIRGREL